MGRWTNPKIPKASLNKAGLFHHSQGKYAKTGKDLKSAAPAESDADIPDEKVEASGSRK